MKEEGRRQKQEGRNKKKEGRKNIKFQIDELRYSAFQLSRPLNSFLGVSPQESGVSIIVVYSYENRCKKNNNPVGKLHATSLLLKNTFVSKP